MFLDIMLKQHPKLIETGFQMQQSGVIQPDSYLIDMDMLKENARKILTEAKKQQIDLYFMLKQVGRNPIIAKELIDLGYRGAVVVDFREAQVMMKHHIPIANVGHLVQTPKHLLADLVAYGCEYFTVFSIDKIKEINACAKQVNKVQKIMLKVVGEKDMLYSGQFAGFRLDDLPQAIEEIKTLSNVEIQGVTSFPCFLYDEASDHISPTPNLLTLMKAKALLAENDIYIENVNAPSTTSVATLKQMGGYGINSGEPGHGLTGTTPFHANHICEEKPCVLYVSEVSHNFDQIGYCYGGGHYRRSHIKQALVGTSLHRYQAVEVIPPSLESIDYYFGLSKQCKVSEAVLMAFRFQIFVTRSNVCLVEGISSGKAKLLGTFTSLGDEIK